MEGKVTEEKFQYNLHNAVLNPVLTYGLLLNFLTTKSSHASNPSVSFPFF